MMDNIFEPINVRFHGSDKNKILVMGIFSHNKSDDNQIIAKIDGSQLQVKKEIKEGAEIRRKYSWYRNPIDTEYFFWFDVPANYDEKKKVEIWQKVNNETKKIYQISLSKLSYTNNETMYSIDEIKYDKGNITVSGWIIWEDGLALKCFDENQKEIDFAVKYGYRRDVIENFPEIDPEDIRGFKINCKTPKGKYFKVILKKDKRRTVISIPTKTSRIKKAGKKIINLVNKSYVYCKRNGLKNTVKKVKDKISNSEENKYEVWLKKHIPSKEVLNKQRERQFNNSPKISIVIPLYKTPKKYLFELLESIKNQTYSNWELCLSDGSGPSSSLQSVLEEFQKKDKRIKVVYKGEQLQISQNTNEALSIVTGDFVAFADHDDLLAPNALYECVRAISKNPEIRAIYSDEDKISMDGKKHFQPHFKPDFNKDLLHSTNYFCHLFVVDKTIIDEIGGLDATFDGAQDYDFVLRCSEVTEKIYHIPKILYHWRAHVDSTAENPESKMYAFEAGAKAIKAHYDRVGLENTKVEQTECLGVYRTFNMLNSTPLVSIIIPNKDHIDDLDKCIKSIRKSNYDNYEIIIVENNSEEKQTFQFYKEIGKSENVKVIYFQDEFNFSAINNYGVEHAKGDYLLFLNNDTEIINEACISELLGFCMRENVGAVGARLYFGDDTIQHAGVVIGLGGIAGHIFLNTPRDEVGYFARIITQQDYSAVTAACVMVKRSIFEKIGGFDTELKVAFNDIDLCLRIRKEGALVVYNPYAELYHYESKSRGQDDTPEKIERFNKETAFFENRWKELFETGDSYYNRNFAIDRFDCSLR